MGKVLRCLTADGSVMAAFLDSTDMVAKAEEYHHTSAVTTAEVNFTIGDRLSEKTGY